ncbi:hypothetical protein TNCV_3195421 [Trichonephila clavipes]|nr:hypothetical protein TNCV_3195421 [Trichonephila clavipes]
MHGRKLFPGVLATTQDRQDSNKRRKSDYSPQYSKNLREKNCNGSYNFKGAIGLHVLRMQDLPDDHMRNLDMIEDGPLTGTGVHLYQILQSPRCLASLTVRLSSYVSMIKDTLMDNFWCKRVKMVLLGVCALG